METVKKDWRVLAAISLVAALLVTMRPVYFLFTIPLYLGFWSHGIRGFLIPLGVSLGFSTIVELINQPSDYALENVGFTLLSAGVVAGAALWLAHPWRRFRSLYRFLLVAALLNVLILIQIQFMQANEDFMRLIGMMLAEFVTVLEESPAQLPSFLAGWLALSEFARYESFMTLMSRLSPPTTLLLSVLVPWRIAELVAARLGGRPFLPLENYRLPDWIIWLFLGPFGLALLGLFLDLGFLSTLAWNIGLLAVALYAIQGVGIVVFLWERRVGRRVPRGGLGTFLVFALLFFVGPNVILLIGLTLLGVTELWVNYRNR